MATQYTTEAASQLAALTSQGDRVVDGTHIGGNVRSFAVKRVIASEATGEVVYAVKLPNGAYLKPESLRIYAENPGTAYNIAKIGDLSDDDRYHSAATDISAGGVFAPTPAVTGPLARYKVGTDTADTGWVTLTLGTITSATADQEFVVTGDYVVQN